MEALKVKVYPDPALLSTTVEVVLVDGEILRLGEDLLRTAIETNAIGVAATQIGSNLRAAVIRDIYEDREITYFTLNPTILEKSQDMVDSWEGCLSFPGLSALVKRHKTVTVEFKNVKSEVVRLPCTGLLSSAFQHEIDHLNNILLIDRMSKTQLKRYKNYFKQLRDSHSKMIKKNVKQLTLKTH
jgi:peptide deformylase